eukprot:gene16590-3367_t
MPPALLTTLTVLMLTSTVQHVHGMTYYLSSTTGNDTNTGLSASSPWKSLAMMNTVGGLTGATVLLERGAVWVDETLVLDALTNGTLSAYGDPAARRPGIWHSRSAVLDPYSNHVASSTCVEMSNPSEILVSQVHLAGCFYGFHVSFSAVGVSFNGITFQNNSFADIRTPYGAFQPAYSNWGVAIKVATLPGIGTVTNVTVKNNIAMRLDSFVQASSQDIDDLVGSSEWLATF